MPPTCYCSGLCGSQPINEIFAMAALNEGHCLVRQVACPGGQR